MEAPFYYMPNVDACSLAQCKGKIVMSDGYMGYWKYQDILENGAVGFITYDGNANYVDQDMDQRELRSFVSKGNKLPGVNINAKQAIELVKSGAHGLLGVAEKFAKAPHRYGLRFIWCGSEERGLLGAKAYVAAHEEELKHIALNINLDMIGCIMGEFLACCTSEEKLVHFVEYFASIQGFGMKAYQGVYSSDSTPFADKSVPALSFARIAPQNTATIHNSYDTAKVMSAEQMVKDIDFIGTFVDAMANAGRIPVSKEIPENMKEKLDNYLGRKREKK